MSIIKKNITANIAGSVWQAFLSLAFIPLYIKFMGIESWGLIGIFYTLQAIVGLLDMGIGSALNREMARLSILPTKKQEMRNLARTLEVIYWSVAVVIGITIVIIAPIISNNWIQPGHLSTKTIEQSFLLMGLMMAFQMPIGFYSGGLMGLQKHVLINKINISTGTLRSIIIILVLWLVSPTILAFFLCQIVFSLINVLLLSLFFWQNLPQIMEKAVFEIHLFKGIWKFAAGMTGISILTTVLTQLDKIILSKTLKLEMFGYYTLASVIAINLGRLYTPVFFSIYPKMTQLVSNKEHDELKKLYHNSCQFISVLILPIATVIALFSYEILLLWTRNPVTSEKTHLILSVLICGSALNSLMNMPYALQLSFGWTNLSIFKNLIAIILYIPLLFCVTSRYHGMGAACLWFLLNISYIIFEIPVMHRELLKNEKWIWYLQDVFIPLIACISIAGLARIFFNEPFTQLGSFYYLLITLTLTLTTAIMATSVTRSWFIEKLPKLRLKI